MNRDEAKYILRAYPLGGQDAADPQFHEALEMLKRDPILAAWFAQEQALDTRLSEKFRAFPVPPKLKAQLLAGRIVIPFRAWWQRPVWIATAAACAALLATCAVLLLRSPVRSPLDGFRSYAAETAAKLDHLDLRSGNLAEVRQWLGSRSAPADFSIPASLNGRPSLGCRVFEWKGRPISLVCFKLENQHVVHLFAIDRALLRNMPDIKDPRFAMIDDGIATASWSTGKYVYVLASHGGEEELKRLL